MKKFICRKDYTALFLISFGNVYTTHAYKMNLIECFLLDVQGNVLSLMFVVWDDKALYPLLGGAIPEYANLQTYTALTHKSIELASQKGLSYDFEGSVIKRINHAFREFGGEPKNYFELERYLIQILFA